MNICVNYFISSRMCSYFHDDIVTLKIYPNDEIIKYVFVLISFMLNLFGLWNLYSCFDKTNIWSHLNQKISECY